MLPRPLALAGLFAVSIAGCGTLGEAESRVDAVCVQQLLSPPPSGPLFAELELDVSGSVLLASKEADVAVFLLEAVLAVPAGSGATFDAVASATLDRVFLTDGPEPGPPPERLATWRPGPAGPPGGTLRFEVDGSRDLVEPGASAELAFTVSVTPAPPAPVEARICVSARARRDLF